jgi:hypothetical protein
LPDPMNGIELAGASARSTDIRELEYGLESARPFNGAGKNLLPRYPKHFQLIGQTPCMSILDKPILKVQI